MENQHEIKEVFVTPHIESSNSKGDMVCSMVKDKMAIKEEEEDEDEEVEVVVII